MAFDSTGYKNAFAKENYDRIGVYIRKGRKDDLKALAKREGLSMNELFIRAMLSTYGIDLSKDF